MRSSLDGPTSTLYTGGAYDTHIRLKVENVDGTFISLEGRYNKLNVKFPDPQEPIGSMNVDILRDSTIGGVTLSLAPLVEASDLNEDDVGAYSPLLQIGRMVTLEANLTAVGGARPADGDSTWYEIFRGVIGKVDWPDHDKHIVKIIIDGLGAVLQHAKSEDAYTYDAGTSLETVVSEVLSNNGHGSVPTFFPAATGKVLPNDWAPGLQKTVWAQIDDVAKSMGWVVYYRYRGQNPVELTVFEPARGKSVADHTVETDDFKMLSVDDAEVRNVGFLIYVDSDGIEQSLGPDVDSASLTKYGGSLGIRRPFWIKLDEFSPIRAESEAQEMLTAALSDVADVDVVAVANTMPLIFGESGVDLYDIPARDRFFDTAQKWALFSNDVSFEANREPRSSTGLRGTPTAGAKSWRDMSTRLPQQRPLAPVQPPFDQLVGYWPCDNFDGTKIYDVTSNEHDAAVGTAAVTRVQGVAGMALDFPGLGSGYQLLTNAVAGGIEDLFYVACWIKVSTVVGAENTRLFTRDDSDYWAIQLKQNTAFPQALAINKAPTDSVTLNGAIKTADVWHFILCQWDHTNNIFECWVGEQDKELELIHRDETLAAKGSTTRPIAFGSATEAGIQTTKPFEGAADDLRIGSGNLHKNEIDALFRFPGAPSPPKIDGDNVNDTFDITAKSITADTGLIGGWSLSSSELSNGNMKLQSTAQRALFGAATDATTGIGIFLGLDTLYQFRAGNPAGDNIHWDGANLNITGEVTATSGLIGGWTISAGELSSGSMKLQSTAERILVGAATAPLTGIGIFLGKDVADYEFRVGNPAGEYIHWDGTSLNVNGTIIDGSNITTMNLTAKSLTADTGTVGGWTLASGTLSSGSVTIDATNEHILMGAASAPSVGIGVFLGKDGADYEFRAGNPAGNMFHWDGADLILTGAIITGPGSGSSPSLLGWNHNITFVPDATNKHNALDWGTGTIRFTDGTTYSIVAGTSVGIAAITYIYLDTDVSSGTVLQSTTTQATAVGDNKVLVAVALNSTSGKDLEFQVFGGQSSGSPKLIVTDNLAVNSVTFNEIAGNTIIASNIDSMDLTTQSLTATVGAIGGWDLGSNTLSSLGISINSSTEQMLFGSASAFLTGTGIFIGKDSGTHKFRIGDPNNDHLFWNGSQMHYFGNQRYRSGSELHFYNVADSAKGSIRAVNNDVNATGSWAFTTGDVALANNKRLEFGGAGSDTYMYEHTALNQIRIVAGGVDAFHINTGGPWMPSGRQFVPGGTASTYYHGTGGVTHTFVVSNTQRLKLDANRLELSYTGNFTDETAPFILGGPSVGDQLLYMGFNNTSDYSYIGSVRRGIGYTVLRLNPNGGNVYLASNKWDVGVDHMTNDGATTGQKFIRMENTGGVFYIGLENSTGSFFGGSAYESILYSPGDNIRAITPDFKVASTTAFCSLYGSSWAGLRLFPAGRYSYLVAAQNNISETFEITPSTASGGSTFSTPGFTMNPGGEVGIGQSPNGISRLAATHAGSTEPVLWLTHSHATNPRGIQIDYTGGAPDNDNDQFLRCIDTGAVRMEIQSDGDVWTVDDGELTSDETIKENITTTTPKLDDVMKLRVINYNWTDELHTLGSETQMRKRIGFGASETAKIFPSLVREKIMRDAVLDDYGEVVIPALVKKTLRRGTIGSPILVKAFQESVHEYRTEIANLKRRINTLEAAA